MTGTIVLIIVFIIFSAFSSGSETAFFSLSKAYRKKLERSNAIHQKYAARLLKHPQQLMITLILGNDSANVAISALSAGLALQISQSVSFISESVALTIEIILVTMLILIIGDITPKTYAIQSAERFAPRVSLVVGFLKIILFPIVKILEWLIYLFTPNKKALMAEEKVQITPEDIRSIIHDGESFALPTYEQKLLNSAFEFSDKRAKEIMTPRVDIVAVDIADGLEKLVEVIKNSGYSRIPIYRGNIDSIIGIVYAKDVILSAGDILKNTTTGEQKEEETGKPSPTIRSLLRKCHFVPENIRINHLLNYFRKNKIHLAIVVDEYGGTSGLVTLEDTLEEIVGEILDESDKKKIYIKKLNNKEYLIDVSIDLDELRESFNMNIDDEFDSVSGFLYSLFGRIPEEGEKVVFDDRFEFTVEKLDEQRIKILRLKILK
ncbi:MAG: hemolysin family protein [Candidatus Cloacimonadia bacterium]